jgi:hypothetical protein
MFNTRIPFAGIMAGTVMGMLETLFEAFARTGLWTPLALIGATVLRELHGLTPPAPFLTLTGEHA